MASIAGLSIVGLLLGILAFAPSVPGFLPRSNFNEVLGIAVSLLVLIISLLEAAGRHAVNSDRLHSNAVSLSQVQRELGVLISRHPTASDAAWQQAINLQAAYEARIRECPVNHQPIDDLHFIVQHWSAPEFASLKFSGYLGFLRRQVVRARYFLAFAWLPILSGAIVITLWTAITGQSV
jgi:hypothetical protein